MKISTSGECVKMTKQEIVQDEVFQEIKNKYNKKVKIFSFNNFVPDIFKIPFGLPVSFTLFGTKYQIDLISLFLTLNAIGLIGLWLKHYRKEK